MAEGRGQGVPREVPSVALDRLFLELHDQLPKESRERFAQLADRLVLCLGEANKVVAPVVQRYTNPHHTHMESQPDVNRSRNSRPFITTMSTDQLTDTHANILAGSFERSLFELDP